MVSFEPLKYLLLSGEGIFDFPLQERFQNLDKITTFGSSGNIAYRTTPTHPQAVLQLLGIGILNDQQEDSDAFIERYGSLSIHIISNSEQFIEQARVISDRGCKKHKFTHIDTHFTLDEISTNLLNFAKESLILDDPDSRALFHVVFVHITQQIDGPNPLNGEQILHLFESIISKLISSQYLHLPSQDWVKIQPNKDSQLMNELFIRSGALSAVVPKAHAHSLWVSVIGGEVLSNEPEEEPLLRQSFHMAFGKDISSELSNKRLCFLHFCPGHTRIDDIREFNSQSLQKGCWKTLLAEQFLSEIAYRLHCPPKFGA
ncbi:MAG: hypothetical protein EZS28_024132 [Streblomastix strix]|uniref:Uncharacterized protein n=1 Tax=Streblomastix strix TaxID=222440 RepID=A0A5J4VCW9_9EUKA|nr:MAG: hypothetical protein EZS28_024132 [Streblomastix strix]